VDEAKPCGHSDISKLQSVTIRHSGMRNIGIPAHLFWGSFRDDAERDNA